MTNTADIDMDARAEPFYAPHDVTMWALPSRELDAERVVATYQHSTVVRTFERHQLTTDLIDELDALLEAYLLRRW